MVEGDTPSALGQAGLSATVQAVLSDEFGHAQLTVRGGDLTLSVVFAAPAASKGFLA